MNPASLSGVSGEIRESPGVIIANTASWSSAQKNSYYKKLYENLEKLMKKATLTKLSLRN